ncbi:MULTISPECIES: DinB family protein [unclassified Nocardia]|uniref:DinB family protein n=1 Tax=unclassified Nocardia TaxID=2637762 RepID=UPI001CE493F3|nr:MULTISPECIES: DinB family protein [unclassified Nocardia]
MPIVPDTKNWTWVLERVCPECGFDAGATAYEAVPELTRDVARRFATVLRRPDAAVRPDESTWSALEYGAHVRDVCRLFDQRLALMLAGTPGGAVPKFANWDQDETAIADGYATQDPAVVSADLSAAAEIVAHSFESVPAAERAKQGARSDGATFTVDSFARYFIHDLVHHAYDVKG